VCDELPEPPSHYPPTCPALLPCPGVGAYPLHPFVSAAVLLGWRLGLGWLLGRRFLVVTTVAADGRLRRSVVRYAFAGGNFYVPADGGAWQDDLESKATSTVQAYPGPKGVTGRRADDARDREVAAAVLRRERPGPAARLEPEDAIYVFTPTGDRVPEMLPPDLVWVWGPLLISGLTLLRRRPPGTCLRR
jgi:hypothetical protein